VFDAQGYNLRTTVTVQNNPVSIAAAPESSKVYVVNSTGDGGATFPNGSISIIKTSDDSVLNVAPPSANPFYVTIQ
jgi:DNA-binding beta-propeller fold protein YncE